jgi:hypothetical protein
MMLDITAMLGVFSPVIAWAVGLSVAMSIVRMIARLMRGAFSDDSEVGALSRDYELSRAVNKEAKLQREAERAPVGAGGMLALDMSMLYDDEPAPARCRYCGVLLDGRPHCGGPN